MSLEIRTTNDGSTTIYNTDFDENYHSIFGAVQEALHVYIQAGFEELSPSQSRILEIGFGTGLNALLTCEQARKVQKHIIYHSLEKFPLSEEIVTKLDFGKKQNNLVEKLHKATWNKTVAITPFFHLKKIHTDLLCHRFTEKYDLIYYDAFSPDKQPELWTPKILQKVIAALLPNGILTTYSTKGIVKQAFRDAGLEVRRLSGPPGKRDMLRCQKKLV